MKLKYWLIVMSLLLLNGCAGIKEQMAEGNKLHQEYLVKLYKEYQGQLMASDKSHATLIGFPYQGFNNLKTSGFIPSKVGETNVKSLWKLTDEYPHPVNWANRPQYGWHTPDQSLLPLRIKPGIYDIEVWGGAYSPVPTLIPSVKIEVGKAYVIYPQKFEKFWKLSIREYKFDSKFKSNESEYYLVGKPVSEEVVYGNRK